eukprot:872883-Prymnesium_polylepis.2
MARLELKAIVASTQAVVCQRLAVRAARRLHGFAVVGSREGQRHIRCGRPALRPAALQLVAAARHPPIDLHQPLGVVHIVEHQVREAFPPVAVVLPVRVGRRVVKVDQPCHALKGHALDRRVEQLAAHHLGAVLDLDQIVQRLGDRKGRIVRKAVEWAVLRWIKACTRKRCGRVVVVVLCPPVAVGIIRLEVARYGAIGGGGQPLPPCQ